MRGVPIRRREWSVLVLPGEERRAGFQRLQMRGGFDSGFESDSNIDQQHFREHLPTSTLQKAQHNLTVPFQQGVRDLRRGKHRGQVFRPKTYLSQLQIVAQNRKQR